VDSIAAELLTWPEGLQRLPVSMQAVLADPYFTSLQGDLQQAVAVVRSEFPAIKAAVVRWAGYQQANYTRWAELPGGVPAAMQKIWAYACAKAELEMDKASDKNPKGGDGPGSEDDSKSGDDPEHVDDLDDNVITITERWYDVTDTSPKHVRTLAGLAATWERVRDTVAVAVAAGTIAVDQIKCGWHNVLLLRDAPGGCGRLGAGGGGMTGRQEGGGGGGRVICL
jgi:hypothetical protein